MIVTWVSPQLCKYGLPFRTLLIQVLLSTVPKQTHLLPSCRHQLPQPTTLPRRPKITEINPRSTRFAARHLQCRGRRRCRAMPSHIWPLCSRSGQEKIGDIQNTAGIVTDGRRCWAGESGRSYTATLRAQGARDRIAQFLYVRFYEITEFST
jgi:hypothetical protein